MKITSIPIADINPAPYNPRIDLQPGDAEYDRLAKVIDEFDLVEPLVWNKATGNLVGGHQRLKILLARGDKRVKVSVVELTAAKEKALNIALNKTGGDWDLSALRDLLLELDTGDFDMDLTGFGEGEIGRLTQTLVGDVVEDDPPAPPDDPVSKPGDLWLLGKHRVMCGDSTSSDDVEKLMGGGAADLVFTDPPYGVNYTGKTKDALTIKNDSKKEMYPWLLEVFVSMWQAMQPGASYYVCCPAGSIHRDFINALEDAALPVRQGLVWLKDSMVLGHSDYHYKHEPILYGWKDGGHYFTSDRTQTSVFDIPRPKRSSEHPTMKPVELPAMAINNSLKQHGLVFDPFLGSGTTLIAAEQLGRKCYGMEIDPRYCDVIVKRWENFTGKKAKLDG